MDKMAFYRFIYRRRGCLVLCLLATTLWVLYLIISTPAASDNDVPAEGLSIYSGSKIKFDKESITRKQVAVQEELNAKELQIADPLNKVDNLENKNDEIKKDEPPLPDNSPKENSNIVIEEKEPNSKEKIEEDTKAKENKSNSKEKFQKDETKSGNKTVAVPVKPDIAGNETKPPLVKEMGLDTVLEIGERFKNKTLEVGAKVRNKTLEKLVDFGVIQKKEYVKLIYLPVDWPLNLTVDEIGSIMKETEFMKKEQNLSAQEYQPLLYPKALRKNDTKELLTGLEILTKEYGLGYCNCTELSCLCCVRVMNKQMHLNSTACAKIDFLSKSQELDFLFSLDKKPILKKVISAEFPPRICMESQTKVAGACVLFSRVVSHVDKEAESHKMQLAGCMELDLMLFNRTLSTFPVSCFRIPGGDEKEQKQKALDIGNFMP